MPKEYSVISRTRQYTFYVWMVTCLATGVTATMFMLLDTYPSWLGVVCALTSVFMLTARWNRSCREDVHPAQLDHHGLERESEIIAQKLREPIKISDPGVVPLKMKTLTHQGHLSPIAKDRIVWVGRKNELETFDRVFLQAHIKACAGPYTPNPVFMVSSGVGPIYPDPDTTNKPSRSWCDNASHSLVLTHDTDILPQLRRNPVYAALPARHMLSLKFIPEWSMLTTQGRYRQFRRSCR